jgi:hypothetical protein
VHFEELCLGEKDAQRLEKEPAARSESGVPEREESGELHVQFPTDKKDSSGVHSASGQDASLASQIYNTTKSKVNLKDSSKSRKARIVNLDHES